MALITPPDSAIAQTGGVQRYQALLNPVPTNRVNGSGLVQLQLSGTQAQVAIQTDGLANSWHAMHIHINGQGRCPDASMAKQHNNHMAISSSDAAPAYGPIMTSLTVSGDTGQDRAFASDRFPSGGKIDYARMVTLSQDTVTAIQNRTAVIVVHGIDYNGSGHYDDALGPSEDHPGLSQDATAPALCGTLVPFSAFPASAGSPRPAVANGTGSSQQQGNGPLNIVSLAVACAGLAAALMAAFYSRAVLRRLSG